METVKVESIPIVVGQEEDGLWWSDIESMPGVMTYAATRDLVSWRVQDRQTGREACPTTNGQSYWLSAWSTFAYNPSKGESSNGKGNGSQERNQEAQKEEAITGRIVTGSEGWARPALVPAPNPGTQVDV